MLNDFLESVTQDDLKNGKIILTKGTKVNQKTINDLKKKNLSTFSISEESLLGFFISSDIINEKTGKIYFEAGLFKIDLVYFLIDDLSFWRRDVLFEVRSPSLISRARDIERAIFFLL